MLRIALCDNNSEHLFEIERCLVSILFDRCEFEIKKNQRTDELIPNMLNGNDSYDLILTDQNIEPFSGIQIAKTVQKYRLNTKVIFITDDISYVIEGYKYDLFDYMMKPVSYVQLKNTINRFLVYNTEHFEHFSYKVRNKILKVRMDDIIYFESDGRKINIYTINGKETFYDKLDEIEQNMKVTFFARAHQSYLVNVHCIRNIFSNKLILDNGKTIPISRSKYNSIKEKFIKYLTEGI